jgi:hypothetical protein
MTNSNLTMKEIKDLLNGWNMNKYGSSSRDMLRKKLGWEIAKDDEHSLADLLIKRILELSAVPATSGLYSPNEARASSKPSSIVNFPAAARHRVRQVIIDVVENKIAYCHAAEAVLNSGWDFKDRQRTIHAKPMQKAPEEVKDFLQSCVNEVGYYRDMYETRQHLLKMIFDAWMRWAYSPEEYKEA